MPKSVGLSLSVALVVTAAIGANGAFAMTRGACSSGQVVKTRSYVFAQSIGPTETMYTPAQVASRHPKSGEVMLSGQMTGGMAAMTTSPSGQRHLEVHICSTGGSVVVAHPSIVISDPMSKTLLMTVPVATMEGIGEGASDYHYGNNVELTAGHHVTVTVTLRGQQAVFHTTVPRSSTAMSMG
ncbi:MAG TPA: hypothetical protein VLV28_04895 [Gaiellaceae bacterium]|nr:hypothetical protein [Gaiellaceae bacterium]